MADVQGLYFVTGVVFVALFAWVLVVLARAPNAVDLSKKSVTAELSVAPPPAATSEDSEAALPVLDARSESSLDSHPEIRDPPASPAEAVAAPRTTRKT